MKQFRFFAPATIANIGPGFDIFGVALNGIGDIVEARLTDSFSGVRLAEVVADSKSQTLKGLPRDERNLVFPVAKHVYAEICKTEAKKDVGVELKLIKRMGIGTGLGSSGSSSVAAAMAVNAALGNALAKDHPGMLAAVLEGEQLACGSMHADNVFPSLLGGFVLVEDAASLRFSKSSVGSDICFAVASPDISVSTREAREALKALPYNIPALVKLSSSAAKELFEPNSSRSQKQGILQAAIGKGLKKTVEDYLQGTACVAKGLLSNDPELLGLGTLKDGIVTPVRAMFIPGYAEAKKAALDAGATGFSISGSGPSVFAVAYKEDAPAVNEAMIDAFERKGITATSHVSTVNNEGASASE